MCVVCGALIFRNGHEVSSRVGDMPRTFNHLFVVINTCQHKFLIHVYEQGNFLGNRGARDTFHHEDTVDVDTSFHNVKHANVIKPGNR